MRRAIFEDIELTSDSGVICVELMKKVQDAGYRLTETPVHHFIVLMAFRNSSDFAGWQRLPAT